MGKEIKIGDLVKIDDCASCYFIDAQKGFIEVQGYQFEDSMGIITKISEQEAEIFIDKERVLVHPSGIKRSIS